MGKMRVRFDTAAIEWKWYITNSGASKSQYSNDCIYDSVNNVIYSVTLFSSLNEVGLFIMNAIDGSNLNSYSLYVTSSTYVKMSLFNSELYITVSNSYSTSYLIIFDTTINTSKSYQISPPNTIFTFSFTSDKLRIIFGGSSNLNSLRSKVNLNELSSWAYLSLSAISFVNTNSQYTFSTGSLSATIVYTFLFSAANSASTNSLLALVSTNDISYNCDSVSFTKLVPGRTTQIPIDLSCSISGLTNIVYSISSSTEQTIPSWIKLNTANRNIIVNTTGVAVGTTSSLNIKSTSITTI